MFQAPTVVKLTAESARPSRASMRRLRGAKDFGEVFPNFDGASGFNRPPGMESVKV